MSHYTIQYTGKDPAVLRRKAINDAIRYNRRAVKVFIRHARAGNIDNWQYAAFMLNLAGIQGYPARALWCYASGKDQQELFPEG